MKLLDEFFDNKINYILNKIIFEIQKNLNISKIYYTSLKKLFKLSKCYQQIIC